MDNINVRAQQVRDARAKDDMLAKRIQIVLAGASATVVIAILLWLAFRDTWERDHRAELTERYENAVKLREDGKLSAAAEEFEKLITLSSGHKLKTPENVQHLEDAQKQYDSIKQHFAEQAAAENEIRVREEEQQRRRDLAAKAALEKLSTEIQRERIRERAESDITFAKYSKISTRMTVKDVQSLLGSPGREMSSSRLSGIETVMYQWSNADGTGSMSVMFQSASEYGTPYMIQKSQFGLK